MCVRLQTDQCTLFSVVMYSRVKPEVSPVQKTKSKTHQVPSLFVEKNKLLSLWSCWLWLWVCSLFAFQKFNLESPFLKSSSPRRHLLLCASDLHLCSTTVIASQVSSKSAHLSSKSRANLLLNTLDTSVVYVSARRHALHALQCSGLQMS